MTSRTHQGASSIILIGQLQLCQKLTSHLIQKNDIFVFVRDSNNG